jgi:hypothetical protein
LFAGGDNSPLSPTSPSAEDPNSNTSGLDDGEQEVPLGGSLDGAKGKTTTTWKRLTSKASKIRKSMFFSPSLFLLIVLACILVFRPK